MNREENIINWEKDAPLLASLKKQNDFVVPPNYFEELKEKIINQVKINYALTKADHLKLPANYFENLPDQIRFAILLDETKNNLLLNNDVLATPSQYFKDDNTEILNTLKTSKSSFKKIININFIRYAAAACILFTTSLGIYINVQRTKTIDYQLSKISDIEIENYLKQNVEASDVPLIIENLENKSVFSLQETKLNGADIDDYLKSTL